MTTSISAFFGRLLSESSSAICAGNLQIIRGSARISLGCAVCRTAVCCHDNPLICNVGISRLRLSTCLPCQRLGTGEVDCHFWSDILTAPSLCLCAAAQRSELCHFHLLCMNTQSLRSSLHLPLPQSQPCSHLHTVVRRASHCWTHLFKDGDVKAGPTKTNAPKPRDNCSLWRLISPSATVPINVSETAPSSSVTNVLTC